MSVQHLGTKRRILSALSGLKSSELTMTPFDLQCSLFAALWGIRLGPWLENTGVAQVYERTRKAEQKTNSWKRLVWSRSTMALASILPLFQVMRAHSFPTRRRVAGGTTLPRMHWSQSER